MNICVVGYGMIGVWHSECLLKKTRLSSATNCKLFAMMLTASARSMETFG
jgi:hypothetical protein